MARDLIRETRAYLARLGHSFAYAQAAPSTIARLVRGALLI